VVYFQGRPAHTHAYPGLFSWATCPSKKKRKSGLIVTGDLLR
jgi:hypothetical protein